MLLADIIGYLSSPDFDYRKLDKRAKLEYHALVAQCETIIEKDKE